MLDDYVHNIPLTKRETAKVYVFRVGLEPSGFGGWVATHPLLTAHNEEASGYTKYEALCSAQVHLEYIIKDHEPSVAAQNSLTRVIVTDQTDATVIGHHTSTANKVFLSLGEQMDKRFLDELVGRYTKNNRARFEKHQAALAVIEAVRDVYAYHENDVIDRINPQFIEGITEYLLYVWDNDEPGDSQELAEDLAASFMRVVSAAICDGIVRREEDRGVFLNNFEVPSWFVAKVEREWKRARELNKYVSRDYQDDDGVV